MTDAHIPSEVVTFSIGEIALLCPPADAPRQKGGIPIGSEVTVVSAPLLRRLKWPDGNVSEPMPIYMVQQVADGPDEN